MQYNQYTELPPWAQEHFGIAQNQSQKPRPNPISNVNYPYEYPYAWDIETNPHNVRARPIVINPPPEGYQRGYQFSPHAQKSRSSHIPNQPSTGQNYYPPTAPRMYSTIEPANIQQYVKNQPSMFVDPKIYPEEKPWEQMNDYERQTKVEQDARDIFFQKLYLDVDDLISERQFDRLPNHNPIEGREAYMQFLYGDYSLIPHFKDKWTYLYQKYHTNP